jgi:hypothetical protein
MSQLLIKQQLHILYEKLIGVCCHRQMSAEQIEELYFCTFTSPFCRRNRFINAADQFSLQNT